MLVRPIGQTNPELLLGAELGYSIEYIFFSIIDSEFISRINYLEEERGLG